MTGESLQLLTRVDALTKKRVAVAAQMHGISEAAFLRRAVQSALGSDGDSDKPAVGLDRTPRAQRITVRLRYSDLRPLERRATTRGMPVATYVAVLVRGHLHARTPLPSAELQALRNATNAIGALGRNVNGLLRLAYQDGQPTIPRTEELLAVIKALSAAHEASKALLKANAASWQAGEFDGSL